MDQINLAQATLDQSWSNMESCVDTLSDLVGLMNQKSIITAAIGLVVLEIRTRQARRLTEST